MIRAVKLIGATVVGVLVWGGLLLSIPTRPAQAQFVTNTPDSPAPTQSSDQATVTLAPLPTVTLEVLSTAVPISSGPAAPIENYALRFWLEADMIDLLNMQIDALKNGDLSARRALQLTAYELEQRFSGAPSDPTARETLIQAMLQSPRGQVDMRWLVRPYILTAVNAQPTSTSFEVNNFKVEMTAARFNSDETADALLHIRYPASADEPGKVLYEEYLMLVGTQEGAYKLLPQAFDLPAAPIDPVQSLTLERLQDVNADTLDDVVLAVNDGDVNTRWYIITNRNDLMTDLTEPTFEIRVGEMTSWDITPDSPTIPVLDVKQFRADSAAPNWDCRSEVMVAWNYTNNYYRPKIAANGDYKPQDSLGCRLFAAEPLFAQPATTAIDTVQNALIDYTLQAPGSSRALMVLSMLYALNGQLSEARAAAEAVQTRAQDNDDPWATAQSNAFLEALNVSSNTALNICEALTRASEDPACDIDAVLEHFLTLTPLTTDSDLLAQLETQGFKPVDSLIVTEIGKAARTVVRFDYVNSGWWAFAAQRDGTYKVERAQAPISADATPPSEAELTLPPNALTMLLIQDNPTAALDIIDSTMQNTGGRELGGELRFARALALEFIGDRNGALRGYYGLWRDEPTTLWGQLAGAHLEKRA